MEDIIFFWILHSLLLEKDRNDIRLHKNLRNEFNIFSVIANKFLEFWSTAKKVEKFRIFSQKYEQKFIV